MTKKNPRILFRLYIKQHFSHPQVDQSVAMRLFTDGLSIFGALTVFTRVAKKDQRSWFRIGITFAWFECSSHNRFMNFIQFNYDNEYLGFCSYSLSTLPFVICTKSVLLLLENHHRRSFGAHTRLINLYFLLPIPSLYYLKRIWWVFKLGYSFLHRHFQARYGYDSISILMERVIKLYVVLYT